MGGAETKSTVATLPGRLPETESRRYDGNYIKMKLKRQSPADGTEATSTKAISPCQKTESQSPESQSARPVGWKGEVLLLRLPISLRASAMLCVFSVEKWYIY